LSFIDLPGIIVSTDKVKKRSYVEFIDRLVKGYANNLYTVVLLPLDITKDVANSKARAVLQDINAESRIVSVFTKSDRPQELSSSEYLKMFFGQGESPNDHQARIVIVHPDMDLVYIEARKFERDFFHQGPWASIGESHRARLGVENLRLYLQQILFTKTGETLPQNIAQITTWLESVS
jgi:hypothetical protein